MPSSRQKQFLESRQYHHLNRAPRSVRRAQCRPVPSSRALNTVCPYSINTIIKYRHQYLPVCRVLPDRQPGSNRYCIRDSRTRADTYLDTFDTYTGTVNTVIALSRIATNPPTANTAAPMIEKNHARHTHESHVFNVECQCLRGFRWLGSDSKGRFAVSLTHLRPV